MKKLDLIYLLVSVIIFVSAAAGLSQTQTVTLTATNGLPASYTCSTSQVISVISFIQSPSSGGGSAGNATISFANGIASQINSYNYGLTQLSSGSGSVAVAVDHNATFTGVTNISLTAVTSGHVVALTFTIATPIDQTSLPVNTVVIPTDATGPVQIVLESSSDLVNWTSSMPGTYGSTYTNRFFRVRAIAQ